MAHHEVTSTFEFFRERDRSPVTAAIDQDHRGLVAAAGASVRMVLIMGPSPWGTRQHECPGRRGRRHYALVGGGFKPPIPATPERLSP